MRILRSLIVLASAVFAVAGLFPDSPLAGFLGLTGSLYVMAALGSFAGGASYDGGGASQGANLDLSQELSAILLADTQFLGRIGSGGAAKQVDHYWVEESLNATYVTSAEALDTSETDLSVSTGDGAKVPIGSLLVNESEAGVDEVLQVTDVSSDTLTIVRAAGDSAPAAQNHLSGSKFRIIAQAKQEGDENVTDRSVARTRVHNVCQIFKREVFISGTMQALDMAGVPNEYSHQLGRRMLEIKRELAMSVWGGVKITNSGAGGSDSVYRSMNGVRNFVRSQSSQLDAVSTAFSEGLINALYKKIYDKGGEASIAVGSAEQMTQFSQLHRDKVRLAPSDRARGVFVTKYLTEYGVELDLLIDRWCLKGDLLLGDPSRVRLMPLNGRQFQATPLDKRGDALRGMIVGEYTLEVRNAAECFALATKLAIP
jgi:hypothetical protein